MLYIIAHRPNGTKFEGGWHVGQYSSISSETVTQVTEVQADGDELMYIRRNMVNVVMNTDKAVNRWYGDMAKFIAANLP